LYSAKIQPSFNPCFGGFFSKTPQLFRFVLGSTPGFNPCFGGFFSKTQEIEELKKEIEACFNPCFGGFFSKTFYNISDFAQDRFVSILVLVDFSLKRGYKKE